MHPSYTRRVKILSNGRVTISRIQSGAGFRDWLRGVGNRLRAVADVVSKRVISTQLPKILNNTVPIASNILKEESSKIIGRATAGLANIVDSRGSNPNARDLVNSIGNTVLKAAENKISSDVTPSNVNSAISEILTGRGLAVNAANIQALYEEAASGKKLNNRKGRIQRGSGLSIA